MTLHEAIEKLLKQTDRPMTSGEIAAALNSNKWYQKKDRSEIKTSQISARVNNYPMFFERRGELICLKGKVIGNSLIAKPAIATAYKTKVTETGPNSSVHVLAQQLMNEMKCRGAGTIDALVPDRPGIYCIRLADITALPSPFQDYLKQRRHNILYIGIATTSLRNRLLFQELRAIGHGTFFRSIGAILGHRPQAGSLINKKNLRNYTFTTAHQKEIVAWINENLLVNWVETNSDLEKLEHELINQYAPLINIAKNPLKLKELRFLREECVRIANTCIKPNDLVLPRESLENYET